MSRYCSWEGARIVGLGDSLVTAPSTGVGVAQGSCEQGLGGNFFGRAGNGEGEVLSNLVCLLDLSVDRSSRLRWWFAPLGTR